MDNQRYTIGELADAADVTPRTIRYYTAEGLLPPPDARGKYALYAEEHLLRLRLIARLKDAYLPLHEIRSRLAGLGPQELAALLDEQPTPSPASAVDYITQVLGRASTSQPRQIAELPQRYAPPIAARLSPPAGPAATAEQDAPPREAGAAPAPAPQGRVSPEEAAARRGESQRGRRAVRQPPQAEPERWQRIPIVPGVELHVREPVAGETKSRVEALVARACELFDPVEDQSQEGRT